ncbi:TRAP transporter substrate-binding protein DctP [Jannaschia seohaensis]|uniref:TRAP-type C4-dicarboxylate transport system substrate-binding protein n=1 Tax=Jannaschia seohaensis TaxID=475081 RepID=A0A2Y9B380_9RHOB|nr:TRAP transporter substrate-binding protein DctP [Jannaschia seohaensis]PWJ15079.1 TRAP-type C4-dicarboxylate transport system substrate-binding protein [Jannaschia seohaensis]SSA49928.1 TRAP-type C4-dicarboxylate transport system, substrate-binding protein [Jannaschia seohaensis]
MKLASMLKAGALAALVALPGAAAWADAHTINLRATANSNENDEDYDGLVVFKNYVENASNGAITVELFIGTQLCSNGAECLQGVADGSIDIFVTTSGGAAGIFPYVQIFDLPYLMADDRIAEEVLTGTDLVAQLRAKALEDSGDTIRIMTVGNTGGWRNFANTVRPVENPEDLAGLKIRTVVADLPQELVRALGASPTPIPWPELFTSFQTGVVEGSKNGITDIMGMKFPDAGLQYVTLDGHAYMAAIWVMNNQKFQEMDDAMKRVIVDGFSALQQATFASPKRKSIQAYEEFVAGGGNLYVPTPEQKQAFQDAAAPVYDWFANNVDGGEEMLANFRAAIEEAEAEINARRDAELN